MSQGFAAYAASHEAASIRRCWSTWNVLCGRLFTAELLSANPMALVVGRPKPAKTLPKPLPQSAAHALVNVIDTPNAATPRTDWPERDRAIILTALLTGLRAEELRCANIGDLRLAEEGRAVTQVRGKGNKDRTIPIEHALVEVLNESLVSPAPGSPHQPGAAAPAVG
jgi:integrase/recombinase XerC